MTNLNDIFAFDDMLHKLHLVRRSELARGKDRRENDWEHGYQMAMLCWYLADSSGELNLNLKKVIAYALAHDVVEVYAGDTPFHQTDEEKQDKEREAMRRLSDEFGEFVDLHESIENYENQADEEAKFVYAVDKLISMINVYQDNGRSLRKDNVSLETVKRLKSGEFEGVPEVKKLYEDLIEIFAEEKDRLFHQDTSSK